MTIRCSAEKTQIVRPNAFWGSIEAFVSDRQDAIDLAAGYQAGDLLSLAKGVRYA
jgi:hypothetical protein